ncbi:MAG: glycosyltransferase family 2 protein [Solobacterium sp.]|nr:glycosyltransferase family 2 protein [Solobacterium sp.]
MTEERRNAKIGLIRKALRIWAKQYHFVIPREILQMYVHKFMHERRNIAKYGNRFFDPEDYTQYEKWLSFRPQVTNTKPQRELLLMAETETLSVKDVDCRYVLLVSKGCHSHPVLGLSMPSEGDVIYFDNDVRYSDGSRRSPVLKPDYSYNTLRSFNYIGHCFAVKTELLEQFEGEPWNPYRWLLKLSDQKVSFVHVSEIAYSDASERACEAETLKQCLKEAGDEAEVQVNPDGVSCTVHYALEGEPLVSILIPTRDGIDMLDRCVKSVYEKSTYRNFEIIIIDNGSEKAESIAWFEEQEKAHDNLKVVRIDVPFNYSYLNNCGAEHAKGEYIVLLNNDTEVITENWLEEMLGFAQRKNVGSVGVKLLYEDGTIQHGGVITGKGGDCGHRWYQCPGNQKGYLYTLEAPNDVAAVTGACLMTSRKCWDEMFGLNEELTVQYNDVDYCLRLVKAGYFNVFLPAVSLYHYESKSRGIDKDRKAVKRFFAEVNWFKENHSDFVKHDPFYNDGFDKNYDYKLIAGTGSN